MNLLKLAVATVALTALVVLLRQARKKPRVATMRRADVPWGDDL